MPVNREEIRRLLEEREKHRKESGVGEPLSALIYNLPKEGYAKIRHLPPYEDFGLPGVVVWTHWNIPEIGRVHCTKTWKDWGINPAEDFALDCASCQVLIKFRGLLKIDEWISKGNGYSNCLVLEDSKQPSWVDPFTPRILRSPASGSQGEPYGLIWLLRVIDDKEIGDITDPVTGHDVTYKRARRDGPFERVISLVSHPIAETPEKIQEILGKMKKLDQIWKPPSPEEIQKMNKAAELLATLLDNRLAAERKGDVKRGTAMSQPFESKPSQPSPTKPPESPKSPEIAKKISKPPKAPDCYAIAFIDEDGDKTNPYYKTCRACPLDFLCKEDQKKSRIEEDDIPF